MCAVDFAMCVFAALFNRVRCCIFWEALMLLVAGIFFVLVLGSHLVIVAINLVLLHIDFGNHE
jgi:hypothetical protein